MDERKSEKRTHISISSSSREEEEDDEEDSEQVSESSSEADKDYSGEESVEEILSSSTSSDDETDDEADYDGREWSESDDQKEEEECPDENHLDDDFLCQRVVRLLKGRIDLQEELNLNQCKAYLRKHELRISGTKAECLQRIKEHWKIKDGSGEALYPRSSFNIDCTGDVCKGDVVLFTQRVYCNFDKMAKKVGVLGKRTIAGRIVNESYGAAKQQHTFTVEVLWSKGIKKLPPLFPLLVKGRNLYRLKTFRQRWKDEKGRLKVLDEKHKRGAAARLVRAQKITETRKKRKKASSTNERRKGPVSGANRQKMTKTRKMRKKASSGNEGREGPVLGAKHQKHVHNTWPCEVRRTEKLQKGKFLNVCRKALSENQRLDCQQQNAPPGQKTFKHHGKWRKFIHSDKTQVSSHQSCPEPFQDLQHPPLQYTHWGAPSHFPSREGFFSSSTQVLPHFRPPTSPFIRPLSAYQQWSHHLYSHHTYSHPTSGPGTGTSSYLPGLINIPGSGHPFPFREMS